MMKISNTNHGNLNDCEMRKEDYSQNLLLFFFIKIQWCGFNEEFIENKVYFAIYLCACWAHNDNFFDRKEVYNGN